jgi:hypothetical protein
MAVCSRVCGKLRTRYESICRQRCCSSTHADKKSRKFLCVIVLSFFLVNVLHQVHCAVGKSRSVSVVLAHLVARQQMTLRDALAYVVPCYVLDKTEVRVCRLVRERRPMGRPNDGLLHELMLIETCVRSAQSLTSMPARTAACAFDAVDTCQSTTALDLALYVCGRCCVA